MSFISRLFGKPRPTAEPAPAAVSPAVSPAAEPARPDPAAVLRAEEVSLAQAVAAGDRAAIGRWVLEGRSTRVRQAAARAIEDPDQLAELIRAVRGHDKNVYKILTARRDAITAAERAARQREAEVAEIATAIARHVERPVDLGYAVTLERLASRWATAAPDAAPALRDEVEGHLASARAAIEAQRAAETERIEREREAARAAEEARQRREQAARAAAEAAEARARAEETERQAEQAKRGAEAAEVRALIGLLRQAQSALERGGTARALRLREAIADKAPGATGLPPWFERQLQDVDARIQELQDWRTFTVVPKRAELVRRMESLVGAEMSPEELARQIRRLRDEWRTLHRGGKGETTPEHEQFEGAAERAYEPCREHFARQAELRERNRLSREALLARLEAFVAGQDADSPDFRAIQQVIGEARREWREYAPVDQEVVQPLQARLHALLDTLRSRLDAEYARNVAAKRELILRVERLVAVEDTRAAIDEVKSLQAAWKTVGPVPRREDETLWTEFRRHCDAVFERHSQQRASHEAALGQQHARAVALCEEAEQLADGHEADPGSLAKRLAELGDEFDALELPRSAARDLRRRFSRAQERGEALVRRARARAIRDGWVRALDAGDRVRACVSAAARELAADEYQPLRVAAAESVAALDAPQLRAVRATLERQLEAATSGASRHDPAAGEEALRTICVRAELLAGLDTPPEDAERRREHQMRRLVEAMGRGMHVDPGDLEALVLDWLEVGPVEPAAQAVLRARFERCIEALA
jgi:hypothetical protein